MLVKKPRVRGWLWLRRTSSRRRLESIQGYHLSRANDQQPQPLWKAEIVCSFHQSVGQTERNSRARHTIRQIPTQTLQGAITDHTDYKGSLPTYRLASRWHPHSFRKREQRISGEQTAWTVGLSTETLTLWSVRLLPALRRLRCPTVRCRQDPPGGPLSRAKLAGSFAVTRFRLLHFHLDKGTSGAHLARPVKGPWSCSATQPCANAGCLILDYRATFKCFTLVLIP